jgi:hypothetical protein
MSGGEWTVEVGVDDAEESTRGPADIRGALDRRVVDQ